MYDFHMHSSFSSDCRFTMEDMVKGAIKNNVSTIAFTDHIDFEYGDRKLDLFFDMNEYIKELNRLKLKYKRQIEILKGIELGMQPHLVNDVKNQINTECLDFIIMSIHTSKNMELYDGSFYKGKTPEEAYKDYYEDMLLCLEAYDNFDVIGHLNLIERHVNYLDRGLKIEEYLDLISSVLEKIISMDKGIELNTSGMRYGINSFHPSIDILRLYKKLGGEVITIGADAHKPDDTGYMYKEAIELLRKLKYKYISIYKNRKRQYIKIE